MMSEHIYKSIEITGSSAVSIDDAIKGAVRRASQSIRNIGWFEVKEVRGHVAEDAVAHFQVTLKLGFRLEASDGSAGASFDDEIPAPGTDVLHEGP